MKKFTLLVGEPFLERRVPKLEKKLYNELLNVFERPVAKYITFKILIASRKELITSSYDWNEESHKNLLMCLFFNEYNIKFYNLCYNPYFCQFEFEFIVIDNEGYKWPSRIEIPIYQLRKKIFFFLVEMTTCKDYYMYKLYNKKSVEFHYLNK